MTQGCDSFVGLPDRPPGAQRISPGRDGRRPKKLNHGATIRRTTRGKSVRSGPVLGPAGRNAVELGRTNADDRVVAVPARQVRAKYSAESITVYQAYSPETAGPAVAAGRFAPPFKRERMTWIKPSFLWMMYRCGWATKPGQERVLAVEITRAGFEWALEHACVSHFDPAQHRDRRA
jgi:hypothetical protein